MQTFKRLSAILLAVIILALSLPTATVFAANSDMRYGRTKLDANWQYIYDKLVIGCESADPEIEVDISGLNLDFSTFNEDHNFLYEMFYGDYPEYFWVNKGHNGASVLGNTLTLKPSYSMTGSTLANAKSAYNAKVDELTKGLSGKSDYEKAKIIHDRVVDTVTYISREGNDQNAYNALVEGKAVCNGYARAYQHLLSKVGIPARYVAGSSINPTTNTPIGHAWNLVKIDGQWYYTDVTWDDQGANTFYAYFNITTQQLLKDHTFDSEYESLVPTATATTANYYVKEDRVFSGYDQAKFVSLLKKDSNKTQIYIDGNVDSFVSSLNSNLASIASDLGANGSYSVSYNMSQLGNALIINVVVISGDHTHTAKATITQKDATCLSPGTKTYYVCDCGLKFLDQACTQQITNDKQLEITAKSHSPSGWKNNASDHWKECTMCGSETANTRSAHSDNNKDNKCDTCGYALPVADASGNIIIGIPSNSTTSSQNTNQSDNSSIDSSVSSETENTESATQTESDESQSYYTDEPTSIYEDTYLYASAKLQNTALKWIIICGVAALFVAIAATVTVILVNKKRT